MMNRLATKARQATLCSLLFFMAYVLGGCSSESGESVRYYTGQTMGTQYHITLVPGDTSLPDNLQQQVQAHLDAVDESMSTYIETSELSQLNDAPVGEWVEISEPLYQVLELAMDISDLTDGAYDVTVGPLVNLWGFGPEDTGDAVPDEQAISEALAQTGYDQLELNPSPPQVRKAAAVQVDLSSIAKGYGADVVAHLFDELGFTNYLIEVGGDLRVKGRNPRGEPWRIGVEKPALAQGNVQQAISLSDGGVATSGDYRNYFEVDGERYSHIIDPRLGRPVTHNLVSVTVVGETARTADGLATAMLVMGPQRAMNLAQAQQLPIYLIVREEEGFSTEYSPAFAEYLESN